MSTKDELFADAVARSVAIELETRKRIFIPRLVSPFPIGNVVTALSSALPGGVRFAILEPVSGPVDAGELSRITTEETEAVVWRNEADSRPFILIGRPKHASRGSLGEVPALTESAVRDVLMERVQEESSNANPRVLQFVLERVRDRHTPLAYILEYLAAVLPLSASSDSTARGEMWRLGLIPDLSGSELGTSQVAGNRKLVAEIQSSDAKTFFRLKKNLSTHQDEAALRALDAYRDSGDRLELRALQLTRLLNAAPETDSSGNEQDSQEETGDSRSGADSRGDSDLDDVDFDFDFDEVEEPAAWEDLLGGAAPEPEDLTIDTDGEETCSTDDGMSEDSPRGSLDSASEQWDVFTVSGVAGIPYATSNSELLASIAFEAPSSWVPADLWLVEPSEAGTVPVSLPRLLGKFTAAEGISNRDLQPYMDAVIRLLDARRAVAVDAPDIPTKDGLSLLVEFADKREAVGRYIGALDDLWAELERLTSLAQAEGDSSWLGLLRYLVLLDYRISGGDLNSVEVTLSPLHQAVLVPRFRAATQLSEVDDADERQRLLTILAPALDPSVPGIPLVWGGDTSSLFYRETGPGGVPKYSREPLAASGKSINKLVGDVLSRFKVTYPFAEVSFSIGFISPPASAVGVLAKTLRRLSRFADLTIYGNKREFASLLQAADAVRADLEEAEDDLGDLTISVQPLPENRFPPAQAVNHHVVFLAGVEEVPQFGSNSVPVGAHSSVVNEWHFGVDRLSNRPYLRPGLPIEVQNIGRIQDDLTQVPFRDITQQPLLTSSSVDLIGEWASRCNWVVAIAPSTALVPPRRCGAAQLLGRLSTLGSFAMVYGLNTTDLSESMADALRERTWFSPAAEQVEVGLARALQDALSEGLLALTRRSTVDQKIGDAAVAGVLQQIKEERPASLVISLDSREAREWLANRNTDMRADIAEIATDGGEWRLVVHEVKGTSRDDLPPNLAQDSEVISGANQAKTTIALVEDMFREQPEDPLAHTRREVLKRQIFLEALAQLEGLRETDPGRYASDILTLNDMFKPENSSQVSVSGCVWFVSVKQSLNPWSGNVAGLPVRALDADWLRVALGFETNLSDVSGPMDTYGDADVIDMPAPRESTMAGGASSVVREAAGHSTSQDESVPRRSSPVMPEYFAGGSEEVAAEEIGVDVSRTAREVADVLRARSAPVRSVDAADIVVGPSVIQVPFRTKPGGRLAQIQAQEPDVARDLGVTSVRVANFVGRSGYAVVELARANREIPDVEGLVLLDRPAGRSVSLGAQLDFSPYWIDLAALPHLLVGGKSGSGKSMFVRSLLRQLTSLYTPQEVQIVVADGKGGRDYRDFQPAPHIRDGDFLLGTHGILDLLDRVVNQELPERRSRFDQLADAAFSRNENPRNISSYADLVADAAEMNYVLDLPAQVVILDEFGQFSLSLSGADRRHFEDLVTSFAQQARYLGGHMIAATQRPSVETLPGTAKGQFARLALQVESNTDSRVILDEGGAEHLLGRGDLLFKGDNGLVRLQGYAAMGPYRY